MHPLPAANGARTAEAHDTSMTRGVIKLGRAKRGRVRGLLLEAALTEPPSGGADSGAYSRCPRGRARRGWWRGSPVGAGGAVRTAEGTEVAEAVTEATKTARGTPTGTRGKLYPFGGCNALDISAIRVGSRTKKPL